MQSEIVNLSQIKLNEANPRTITDDNFRRLVNSILVLPKMLELRPIAVDSMMVALGGNMRTRALASIKMMYTDEIIERLNTMPTFQDKTPVEKQILVDYWTRWQENPTAHIVRAESLSDAEKREFIVKDNVSFGTWDYDELANSWDAESLQDWGLDVWQTEKQDDQDDDEGDSEPVDYRVIVTCKSEHDQQLLLTKLSNDGYKCAAK